jgi:ribosomal protein S18 acetylase RimI-like enzyme
MIIPRSAAVGTEDNRGHMSTIRIRPAVPEDGPRISELLDQLGYRVGPDEVDRRLAVMASDRDKWMWVAETGNRLLVGCLQATVDRRLAEGDHLEVTSLVVDGGCRGKGVGRQLVAVAESLGKAIGSRRMRVRCNRKRSLAHGFYRGLGYAEAKIQTVFEKDL